MNLASQVHSQLCNAPRNYQLILIFLTVRVSQGTSFDEEVIRISIGTQTWAPVRVYKDQTYDLEDVESDQYLKKGYEKKAEGKEYRYGNIPNLAPEEQKQKR